MDPILFNRNILLNHRPEYRLAEEEDLAAGKELLFLGARQSLLAQAKSAKHGEELFETIEEAVIIIDEIRGGTVYFHSTEVKGLRCPSKAMTDETIPYGKDWEVDAFLVKK